MSAECKEVNNEIRGFLQDAELPVSDLEGPTRVQFFTLREAGRLAGIVGIEIHGSVGLLRSLAVHREYRESGKGRELVALAEAWACENGIEFLYLLTTTAEAFFARLGYAVTDRAQAPEPVAHSAQFSGLCPASASFMGKRLCQPDIASESRHGT